MRRGPALRTPSHTLLLIATIFGSLASCRSEPQLTGRRLDTEGPPRVLIGTRHDGAPFDLAELGGSAEYALVFFGFTSCPDVCPITLSNLGEVLDHLEDGADRVAVVFAAVDPQRDTLEQLSTYVRAFDKRALGVRLDEQQLAATKESFGLVVDIHEPEDPARPDHYAVDHTGTLFLVDAAARVVLTYPAYTDPGLIAGDLNQLLG